MIVNIKDTLNEQQGKIVSIQQPSTWKYETILYMYMFFLDFSSSAVAYSRSSGVHESKEDSHVRAQQEEYQSDHLSDRILLK